MKKNKQKTLRTKRLRLTPRDRAEMEALRDAETDPALRAAYDEMLALMARLPGQEEWACDWRVALGDGTTVGGLGFKGPPDGEGLVELGYGIDPAHRGQGYAAEAAKALTEWALTHGAKAVWAQTEPENVASRRVLEKCGFVPDGDGPEGPRYVYRLPEQENTGLTIGMCLGLSLGMLFGSLLFDNMSIGMCVGMALGLCLGVGYDQNQKKKKG